MMNHELLEGLLLSDGYLEGRSSVSSAFSLGQQAKNKEYVTWVAANIGLDGTVYDLVPKKHWRSKGTAEARFRSFSTPDLLRWRERWYRPRKVVPKDLVLTPAVMLHWFIGDGNLSKSEVVRLSTCSFSTDDVKMLMDKLSEAGLHPYASSRNEVYLRKQSTMLFFGLIGPCPVGCYQYKWPQQPVVTARMSEESKSKIVSLYRSKQHTISSIGEEFGISGSAVARWLRLLLPKEEYRLLKKARRERVGE